MHTLKVYDKKNPERLLGTYRTRKFYGHSLCVPVVRPVTHSMLGAVPTTDRVEFDTALRTVTETDDWAIRSFTQERVLETDAPLDDLMTLPHFRVHGESEMHHYRRYY